MRFSLAILRWLNRFVPRTPAPARTGYDWRIVLGLIVAVPTSAIVGVLVLERFEDPHPMVGECVTYSGGEYTYGFGTAKIADCDGIHTGKVVAVVEDHAACPAEADDSFIANFGGDAGRFCIKKS